MTDPPRTRLRPEERRRQLVALGIELLGEEGRHEVSVEELAARACISKALVFHYFGSKADLELAIAAAAADDFFARTDPDPSLPLDRQLEQGLTAFVRYVSGHRRAFATLLRGPAAGDAAMRALFETTRGRVVGRIVDRLGPELGSSVRVRLVVRGWVALAEELASAWALDAELEEAELVALLRDSLVQLVSTALDAAR